MNHPFLKLLLALASNGLLAVHAADLRADSAVLDGKTGHYTYRGNAVLNQNNIQIRAEEMQATQDSNGNLESGRFRGEPAELEHTDPVTGATAVAQAREIQYDTRTGHIQLSGNASLVQREPNQHREMRLQADQIELTEVDKQLRQLSATGTPARFSRQQDDAQAIEGQAQTLRYQSDTEKLELDGEARLQQGRTTFEHVIILYDGIRKQITAPKRDGQQVKITRSADTDADSAAAPQRDHPQPTEQPELIEQPQRTEPPQPTEQPQQKDKQ